MRATTTTALATGALLAALATAPVTAQDHRGHQHGERAPQGEMMHDHMADCPMMGTRAMGPERLLEQAEELGLTAEQVAELEALAERHAELREEMMGTMEAVHDTLTPEQLETLRETMPHRMGGRMEGPHRMEGMPHMRGMMHEMHEGEGMRHMHRGAHPGTEGMMHRPGMHCPMMGGMDEEHEHGHPRNDG